MQKFSKGITSGLAFAGLLMLSSPLYAQAATPATSSSAQSKFVPEPVPAEMQELLLAISNDQLCDPESEMYCAAHTVFAKEGYAVVLASVQPTSGLFQVYQQISKANPQTAAAWKLIDTYSLDAYQEELTEAKLPKALQTYFITAIEDYFEQRQKKNP